MPELEEMRRPQRVRSGVEHHRGALVEVLVELQQEHRRVRVVLLRILHGFSHDPLHGHLALRDECRGDRAGPPVPDALGEAPRYGVQRPHQGTRSDGIPEKGKRIPARIG